MDYSALIIDYLDDAQSHLNVFDTALMSLEKHGYNREVIQNSLGSLHTLKGNSGMMGFDYLKSYIHTLEELLKKILDRELSLSRMLDTLFTSANVIRTTLQEIGNDPAAVRSLEAQRNDLVRASDGPVSEEKKTIDLSSYLGSKTDTIKVDFKRLDTMLNLIGELVIFKTRLNQVGDRIRTEIGTKSLKDELTEALEVMGKIIAELQERTMKIRMLPVRYVFRKFPKMVRDLAKSLGKEVEVVFEGEDTEIDKTVIDSIEEPLLHMVRNAVDHGIEPPDERARKRKRPSGTITLSASQESNYVILKIRDDGRGIDPEDVRVTALDKGLLKPDEDHDRDYILSLIFSPGFTTKTVTTDISGRGVGLDVVSRNIVKLNGYVLIDSAPDEGTTFTIKLPLSLAIIPALMVEAAGDVYALPMSAVDETVKARSDDIHVINNREVIRFRESILPVVRLSEFFGLSDRKPPVFYLVIVGKAEKRFAIAVDSLRGQQDIVIKPLDDTLGRSYGVVGASILGDGRIILIVDIMSFYNKKEVAESV